MLKPIKCRVDEAVNRYAKAATLLDDIPLENAVRFYMAHNKSPRGNTSLNQLVCEFLEAKRQDGVSEFYYRDLRKRTRSLLEYAKVETSEINAELIAKYFEHLNFCAVNHNNQYRVIRALINFAKAQGYISEGIDYLKPVRQKRVKKASYPIYQPEEFESLLDNADPEMVPPLVLLGFCGIRPAEMRRLNWRDVRFETRTLIIDATQAKTGSRRTVPLCGSALMWLSGFKSSQGPIWGRKSDF